MEPISWSVVAGLILNYGLPFAEKVVQKATSGSNPTLADFAELRAMDAQTASDRMKAQLTAAGIDLTSPQGISMLALAGS